MNHEKLNPLESAGAAIATAMAVGEVLGAKGKYQVRCLRVLPEHKTRAESLLADIVAMRAANAAAEKIAEAEALFGAIPREEAWSDETNNVVTTVGKNLSLDTILAGSGYTAAIVMGLKGVGTAVAADTMASHASWLEVGLANAPAYTGNRPTPAFSAAAAGVKATSSAVAYTSTSGGTVAGCFIAMAGSATKDNTTGTLLSAGDFTGGNKVVANTDVLNVTYSLAL